MEPQKEENHGPETPRVNEADEPQTNEDTQDISGANIQQETPEKLEKPDVEAPLQDAEAEENQPEESSVEQEQIVMLTLKILYAARLKEMYHAGLLSPRPVPVQEAVPSQAPPHDGDDNRSIGSSSSSSVSVYFSSDESRDEEQDIIDWLADVAKSRQEGQMSSPEDLSFPGAAPESRIIGVMLVEKQSRMRRFWRGIKSLCCCCCVQKPKRCRPMSRTSSSE